MAPPRPCSRSRNVIVDPETWRRGSVKKLAGIENVVGIEDPLDFLLYAKTLGAELLRHETLLDEPYPVLT